MLSTSKPLTRKQARAIDAVTKLKLLLQDLFLRPHLLSYKKLRDYALRWIDDDA